MAIIDHTIGDDGRDYRFYAANRYNHHFIFNSGSFSPLMYGFYKVLVSALVNPKTSALLIYCNRTRAYSKFFKLLFNAFFEMEGITPSQDSRNSGCGVDLRFEALLLKSGA